MSSLSVTVCRRPEYTEQVLRSLLACDGIGGWRVAVFIDSQCERTAEVVRRVSPQSWEIHASDCPLGCNANVRRAMQYGFSGSEYHVHLEDDTLPIRDTLSFFKWAKRFATDAAVFGVTAYSRAGGATDTATMLDQMCAWSFATWSDRFAEIDANWSTDTTVAWDTWIDRHVRNGRPLVTPHRSRIQNIGQHGGTYNTPAFWEREQFTTVMANADSCTTDWRLGP
jgi:hypothetical protein